MKHYRYLLLSIIALITVYSLSACQLLYGRLFVKTKDTNGEEDTTLAVFTEKDICAETMKNYCLVYGMERNGEQSYPEEDYFHDFDIISSNASTPLSGIALQQVTYGKTDTIKFTVKPNLKEGNLRIVLLDENYTILYDFSTEQSSSVEIKRATGKEFEIRAVGESAKFEITTTREFC